jgi:predicted ATPase/DNA-binding SARP family transcriptional activator
MTTYALFLFGVPHLERDGAAVKIPRRKALALLAYLAATGKAHARDTLATLFWPDHGQSEARLALSRHLSELRWVLPAGMLVLEAERVALSGGLWVDVNEFAAIVAAGPKATPANLPTLQAAADLYTADFLAGFTLPDCPDFDDWQAFQTESLRQGLRSVLEKIAWTQAAAGGAENAIATARRWLALDSLDESAHRALMQLYAQAGQQAAALRQYEQCRQILRDELGAPPAAETTQLWERIRRGEISRIANRESKIENPHNLPAQTTPFVGRQPEVAELARLLANPAIKLVTILAPGGMGKTRLGLAVAERQLGRFPDGVFFVPLAPLTSPDDIVTTIAEQVGFTFSGNAPPQQQLLDYFRDRKTLLVLDNFEHLLAGARVVTDLLEAAPAVKVLATSREKLNLSGETVYVLAGLHFPSWEALEDLLAYDAVRLFVQSARRVRPDFEPEGDALDDLARICRLVEGMPLALVLSAGWLDVLSLERIAAEVQRGIDILETEQRDVPERQRSVRATFSYSWERLSEGERDVFMKLSVFRGGFGFEAAAAVAGAGLRTLRSLAGKSLVQALSADRYEVHELLRQYGEEKLRRTDEVAVVRQAHSRYYLGFLAERDEDIKGRRQQAGLQEIRADFENVRQAWLWAVAAQQVDAIGRAALECLVNFAEMSYSALDVHAMLGQMITVLQPAAGQPAHPLWEQAVVCREWVKYLLNEPMDPVGLRIILGHVRERGDTRAIAYCLLVLARHAIQTADYESPASAESLKLWQAVGDPFYISYALRRTVYARPNDLEYSIACLRQSMQIERETGNRTQVCASLTYVAELLALAGAAGEAERLLDEAIGIQNEIGKGSIYIFMLSVKAYLAFWRGELDTAEQLIQVWQEFARGRVYHGGLSLHFPALLSWIAGLRGDYRQGYALGQQLAANPQTRHFMLAWRHGWGLALAHLGLGHPDAARQALYGVLYLTHHTFKAPTVQQICLPLAALLAETPERAAELLGLADRAPQGLNGWTAHCQLLRDRRRDLETALGAEQFAAACERGARLELDAVLDRLLAELQETQPAES